MPVASPALAQGRPIEGAGDLATLALLHLATRPKAWADWFRQTGVETASSYQGHRFDQFTMMIQAATAGLGVALLPLYLIEQELKAGQLQMVIDVPLPTENGYHFVMPNGKLDHPGANELYRWIVEQVDDIKHDFEA